MIDDLAVAQPLLARGAEYLGRTELDEVRRALTYAETVHFDHWRLNGHPYIEHPIAVARILADWRAPARVLVTALLHDTLRPEYSTHPDEIALFQAFGLAVVTDVKRIDELIPPSANSDEEAQEHVARLPAKVVPLFNGSIDALVIRLADRLHNCDDLAHLDARTKLSFAITLSRIYVPVAARLSMRGVQHALADVAFQVLAADDYGELTRQFPIEMRRRASDAIAEELRDQLVQNGVKVEVRPIVISLASIYQHQIGPGVPNPLAMVNPVGIVIANEDEAECYRVLGLIHSRYRPFPGEIQDYIATPKPNGYQSLQTRVKREDGSTFMVLIRTDAMNVFAQLGWTSRWQGVKADWRPDVRAWEEARPGNINVFTPTFDWKMLPRNSTPVDFAYSVHQQIGNTLVGAFVNGRHVPLGHQLTNGDVVHVLYNPAGPGPSPVWLDYAKSKHAKERISYTLAARSPATFAEKGKQMLLKRVAAYQFNLRADTLFALLVPVALDLGFSDLDALLLEVGFNHLDPDDVLNRLPADWMPTLPHLADPSLEPLQQITTDLLSYANYPRRRAGCCNPHPPIEICGYQTPSGNIAVHQASCPELARNVANHPDRAVKLAWTESQQRHWVVEITAIDRPALVHDLTGEAQTDELDLQALYAYSVSNGLARVHLEVDNISSNKLDALCKRLTGVKGVHAVERLAARRPVARSERKPPPYTLYPVSGESFFGRGEVLQWLDSLMVNVNPPQSVIICGPRRIGKTSVLREFTRRLDPSFSHLSVYVDLQAYANQTIPKLLHDIVLGIASGVDKSGVGVLSLTQFSKDPLGNFRTFIKRLSQFTSRQVIVILDEIEFLARFHDPQLMAATVSVLRSMALHHELCFLFSGGGTSEKLAERFGTLYPSDIVQAHFLTELDLPSASLLIRTPAAGILTYEPKLVDRICRVTSRYPYYLQILCSELINSKGAECKVLTEKALVDVSVARLRDLPSGYFAHLWGENLSFFDDRENREFRAVLAAIAERPELGSLSTIDELRRAMSTIGDARERPWMSLERIVHDPDLAKSLEPSRIERHIEDLAAIQSIEVQDQRVRIKVELFEWWIRLNYSKKRALDHLNPSFVRTVSGTI